MVKLKGRTFSRKNQDILKTLKKLFLSVFMVHQNVSRKDLINEQEVLNNIAEMMMETYVSESLALKS